MSKASGARSTEHSARASSYSIPSRSLVESPELRLDAGHYNPDVLEAIRTLGQSGMRIERLADIVEDVFIPPRFKRVYVERTHGIPFLQGSHVVQFRPADLKFLSRSIHRLERWIVHAGWIMVTCSGTIGRTTICPEEWDGWAASQHILRIIPDGEKCAAGYLCAYLASPLGQIQLTANSYGAVVDELTEQQMKSVSVPLPETEEDKELVRSIDGLVSRSTALKSEAVVAARAAALGLRERFGGVCR